MLIICHLIPCVDRSICLLILFHGFKPTYKIFLALTRVQYSFKLFLYLQLIDQFDPLEYLSSQGLIKKDSR